MYLHRYMDTNFYPFGWLKLLAPVAVVRWIISYEKFTNAAICVLFSVSSVTSVVAIIFFGSQVRIRFLHLECFNRIVCIWLAFTFFFFIYFISLVTCSVWNELWIFWMLSYPPWRSLSSSTYRKTGLSSLSDFKCFANLSSIMLLDVLYVKWLYNVWLSHIKQKGWHAWWWWNLFWKV